VVVDRTGLAKPSWQSHGRPVVLSHVRLWKSEPASRLAIVASRAFSTVALQTVSHGQQYVAVEKESCLTPLALTIVLFSTDHGAAQMNLSTKCCTLSETSQPN